VSDDSEHDPLAGLRARIDGLDHEILDLLQRRMDVLADLAAVKREHGLKIRDEARERHLLADRARAAEARGLSVELVESLFRLVMWASRDYQATLKAEVPLHTEPKRIAVIGGKGGIGQRMAQLFRELGHELLIVDLDTELTAKTAAQQADVTLISVPIDVTERVIAEVGPWVPEHGLLMDVTSIKGAPLAAMLASTRASVLGTHPMFGPGVQSFQGQRVVLCPGRGAAWADWARLNLRARGLVITEASAEDHDRAMAFVQVLTHYQTQVLGVALARMGTPLHESLRFTSPAYLMELYVAARHFAQDPALYGPIEMNNPLTGQITRAFREAAQVVSDILERRDQAAFARLFEEVRAFFGEFSGEATEKSRFMMDRLVERS
jgi:chorismate mutase/prephenate dehydrogenase